MADLDFDSTNAVAGAGTSEDPVADFLAREQSVLGELEDDLIFNKNCVGTNISDGTLFNSDSNDIKLNGDLNEFEQSNGDIATTINNNSISNGISDLFLNNKPMNSHQHPSMMSQPIIPAEEPESIKRWREQHLKNLDAKDSEEKEKIEEHRQQAKKELDEWYARYSEQLEKAKKQNRAIEKEWIAERDNEQPGQAWEKISRMCDFNPKTSRNNRDTSRMRSMLLQLKQNPPVSSTSSSSTKTTATVSS